MDLRTEVRIPPPFLHFQTRPSFRMAAVAMISDVHGLHSRISVHVVAQSVGGGPGAEAEAVVICRAAVMVVAAAAAAVAVMLLVEVAVADMTTGAVTVLPTALEWLMPAGETP